MGDVSPMFCTLKEAAQTLQTSEDQIHVLLERGILHEFRQGPHRLLRTADVDALDLGRGRPFPAPAARTAPREPGPARARRPVRRRHSDGATAVARPPRSPRTAPPRARVPNRRRADDRELFSGIRRPSPGLLPAYPSPATRSQSLRQWFWMGMVQDSPVVLALVSGLILVGLSALLAGVCFVCQR